MAIQLPASLANIKLLAFINFALGLVSFVFEIALVAKYGGPKDAAGIWCGIIFGIAGFLALATLRNGSKPLKQVALIFAVLALVFAIVLMGLSSAAIDVLRGFPGVYFDVAVDVIRGLLAIILICSLVAIPVNAFLSIALYNLLESN